MGLFLPKVQVSKASTLIFRIPGYWSNLRWMDIVLDKPGTSSTNIGRPVGCCRVPKPRTSNRFFQPEHLKSQEILPFES